MHDYTGFFNEEIKFRKELMYPPFTRIVEVKLRGRNEEKVIKSAHDLASSITALAAGQDFELVGPAPEFISRIKGQFRWSMMLKGKDTRAMCDVIDKALGSLKGRSTVTITVDVDPLGL
jgi:primosomal protein N' (replication factor Y)